MSDTIDVAAPAASEGPSAPIIENQPRPQPLGSQTPMPEKATEPVDKPEEPSKTAAEAVKRANDKLNAKAEADKTAKPAEKAPAKAEAKTETQAEARARAEDGKFAPKEAAKPSMQAAPAKDAPPAAEQPAKPTSPHRDPPARFSPDAKAEWEAAPDSVKAEVHRAVRELEEGHQKYRESADRYEKVREFDEIARKNGREGVHESLKQVVELENAFQRNPIEGFQKVADHFGLSLRAVASHIMGQDPQTTATQQDQTIQRLMAELNEVKASVGTITRSAEEQKHNQALSQVDEFAKANPRFEELAEDTAFFLQTKKAATLEEAYKLAERLNPSSSASTSQPATPAQTKTAPLSPAGLKSISGAPASGSDPANQEAPISSNPREALDRAFKRMG